MQWWRRARWQSKLLSKTQLPYSSCEYKIFFCCCLTSVCKKIRSFIAPEIRTFLQCFINPMPPRRVRINTVILGKIRVAGQLRKIKSQTVLEADTLILSLYVPPPHPPPGLPTTHINLWRLWNSSLPASSLLVNPFAGWVKDSLWRRGQHSWHSDETHPA